MAKAKVYQYNNTNEIELCPHCKKREIEIDDLGYYGCKKCMPAMSHDAKMAYLDMDGTGQDHEIY